MDDDGFLGKPSQLAQALAILTGEFTGEFLTGALTDADLIIPDFYFHIFIFYALSEIDMEEEGLSRIRKYWGKTIMTGSPTVWESGIHGNGKEAFDGSGSLCHGFATAPIDFFQRSVLGVFPVRPGFEVFKVAPKPFDLKFATGRIPTPKGNILINWQRQNQIMKVFLRIPEGLTASTAAGQFGGGYHEFELILKKEQGNEKIFRYPRKSRQHLRPVLQ
jgi:hypothetical protein